MVLNGDIFSVLIQSVFVHGLGLLQSSLGIVIFILNESVPDGKCYSAILSAIFHWKFNIFYKQRNILVLLMY